MRSSAAVAMDGATDGARTLDADNPWPGLLAFREDDAAFFRGRDRDAAELFRLVQRERLTVLFGLSGLGKSSLLQAGLFPRLRSALLLPVYVRLLHDDAAPPLRAQVFSAIQLAATAEHVESSPPRDSDTLWEHFHRVDSGYFTADNRLVLPVLIFDQFEEVFTRGREAGHREQTAAFLAELADLIEGRPPKVLSDRMERGEADPRTYDFAKHLYKVVLALRADFLADLETLRVSMPSLASNRMRLAPLAGDAALLVTAAGGLSLVPADAGERIVRLVAGEDDGSSRIPLRDLVVDPALLSLFCRELNERRMLLGKTSISAALVEGNRDSILAGFYERGVSDLGPQVRQFVEDRLITVDGYRDSIAEENALAIPGISEEVLSTLVARRLIRRDEHDGRTRLELTHDVLTEIVRQSRDHRRAAEEAEATARRIDSQRHEVAARRFRRVVGLLVVLALGMTVVAALGFVWANKQRALAMAESSGADSARVVAAAAADSLRRALVLMKAAQDSVRAKDREVIAAYDSVRAKSVQVKDALDSVRVKESVVDSLSAQRECLSFATDWLRVTPPPGASQFPYQLMLLNTKTGVLKDSGATYAGETYDLVLRLNPQTSTLSVPASWVYVFAIGSDGNGVFLWSGENPRSQGDAQSLRGEVRLNSIFSIGPPFGKDTFILLSSDEQLDESNFTCDVNRVERTRGGTPQRPFLARAIRGTNTAGKVPSWSIERLALESRPPAGF